MSSNAFSLRLSVPYEESRSFFRSAVIVDVSDMSVPLHVERVLPRKEQVV